MKDCGKNRFLKKIQKLAMSMNLNQMVLKLKQSNKSKHAHRSPVQFS